ncbi:hypothetical protein [Pseudonocardia sp. 73-21]|uniref:hypothetical protein n=1 Tax=Pseudonocardia sp. 73-21 TaxID=1895809 RepID=UPI000965A5B3|nr:hypothetical protein [Pseudonocardia sp. 73-21]OJY42327.1 MAG: hypothetical protein BGP03_10295 [Pseudonocardia sp. 73-21]
MTTPSEPAELTNAVEALGRALERAFRRIESLDHNVTMLGKQVAALVESETDPAPVESGDVAPPGVRSWLLADDAAQAEADLDDLATWVWRVYLWFPDAFLSSCWLWHPEVIEELWWLRVAHADAYGAETGSSLRVGDWHDRQRPGVARRVRGVLAKCDLGRHVATNGRPVEVLPPGPPALAQHAGLVAAVWVAGADLDALRAAGPEPTEEQRAEATAYQQALFRDRR